MRRASLLSLFSSIMALGLAHAMAPGAAHAETMTTCAQAMESIHYHPNIAASSLLASVVGQWQSLDRQTEAAGHPPITGRMVQTPAVMDALVQQCTANPGETVNAAAAMVYSIARQSFEGF